MARPLRIEYEGALHHVMSRGNERRRIVRDDGDRQRRLDWLKRTVETYGWRLHALCLMDNHEHLFVETPRANLSAGMQFLNGSYTSYFNLRGEDGGRRCGWIPPRFKPDSQPSQTPLARRSVRGPGSPDWAELWRIIGGVSRSK